MKYCFSLLSFFSLTFSLLLLLPAAGPAQSAAPRPGILLTVNQTGDSNDALPGDDLCADAAGLCSLRAAVQEANARPGADVINFNLPVSPPSVITLSLGELSVTDSLSIVGLGARLLTVERRTAAGTPFFRIFNINGPAGTAVMMRDLKIRKGVALVGTTGGGLFVSAGNRLELTNVAVSENTAAAGGGGIANAGTLAVTHTLINQNTVDPAASNGGGLLNLGSASNAAVDNTTLTANTARRGAGAYNEGAVSLANVTLAANQSAETADSFFNNTGGSVYAVNTIFGPNPAGTGAGLAGAFNSLGNNIVIDPAGSTGFANGVKNDQAGTPSEISVLLGALANNGGATDTLALLAGSPAIDRGSNCVKTRNCGFPGGQPMFIFSDQRAGYNRYQNGTADIGAFEYNAAAPSYLPGGRAAFILSFPGIGRHNALAVSTNALTNFKQYAVTRQFGDVRINNIAPGYVYIVEIKSKRAAAANILIIPLDDPATFLSRPEQSNDELRITNYELRITNWKNK